MNKGINEFCIVYATQLEGGSNGKRLHAHIEVQLPQGIALDLFKKTIESEKTNVKWLYHQFDVRPIEAGTESYCVSYCLKEGTDALALAATKFPCSNQSSY